MHKDKQMACEKCLHFEACQISFRNSQELGIYDCSEEEYFSTTYDCDYYISKNDYRKASDVAREIFEEISKASADWGCYCITSTKWGYVTHDVSKTLAELKKKYTEGEDAK